MRCLRFVVLMVMLSALVPNACSHDGIVVYTVVGDMAGVLMVGYDVVNVAVPVVAVGKCVCMVTAVCYSNVAVNSGDDVGVGCVVEIVVCEVCGVDVTFVIVVM